MLAALGCEHRLPGIAVRAAAGQSYKQLKMLLQLTCWLQGSVLCYTGRLCSYGVQQLQPSVAQQPLATCSNCHLHLQSARSNSHILMPIA